MPDQVQTKLRATRSAVSRYFKSFWRPRHFHFNFRREAAENLRRDLEDFGRESKADQPISIAVAGPRGVGKSTFINTIGAYTAGRFGILATAGTGTDSMTTEVKVYRPSTTSGELASWRIIDTPGDDYESLKSSASEPGSLPCSKLAKLLSDNGAGCLIVVFSALDVKENMRVTESAAAGRAYQLSGQLKRDLEAVNEVVRVLKRDGIIVLVAVTHIDTCDTALGKDVSKGKDISKLNSSKELRSVCGCVNSATGVPLNQVFPVLNMWDRPYDDKLLINGVPVMTAVLTALQSSSGWQNNRGIKVNVNGAASSSS